MQQLILLPAPGSPRTLDQLLARHGLTPVAGLHTSLGVGPGMGHGFGRLATGAAACALPTRSAREGARAGRGEAKARLGDGGWWPWFGGAWRVKGLELRTAFDWLRRTDGLEVFLPRLLDLVSADGGRSEEIHVHGVRGDMGTRSRACSGRGLGAQLGRVWW